MKDMIYNQTKIPHEQWRYGLRTSAATGCGWISVYNALRLMGYRAEPEDLIRYFERQLPLIHGNAGTNILGPAFCLKQMGFPVKVTAKMTDFDETAREARVCILFYFWKEKWKIGAHFATLEYKDGEFVGYNTFRNSVGPDCYGKSLEKFIQQKKYFGAVLTAVNDMK